MSPASISSFARHGETTFHCGKNSLATRWAMSQRFSHPCCRILTLWETILLMAKTTSTIIYLSFQNISFKLPLRNWPFWQRPRQSQCWSFWYLSFAPSRVSCCPSFRNWDEGQVVIRMDRIGRHPTKFASSSSVNTSFDLYFILRYPYLVCGIRGIRNGGVTLCCCGKIYPFIPWILEWHGIILCKVPTISKQSLVCWNWVWPWNFTTPSSAFQFPLVGARLFEVTFEKW